jgi:hypothetical protein
MGVHDTESNLRLNALTPRGNLDRVVSGNLNDPSKEYDALLSRVALARLGLAGLATDQRHRRRRSCTLSWLRFR